MRRISLLAAFGGLCAMISAGQAEEPAGKLVEHRGWSGCVELKNADCRVVIVPAVGARVAVFELEGINVLHEDPALNGKVLPPGERWMKWDGSQPDTLTPENGNQLEHIWMGKYEVAQAEPLRAVCRSPENKDAGLRQEKEFILDPQKPVLTIKRRLTNISGKAAKWAFWDRTLCPAGAIGVAPVDADSAYKPALWGEFDKNNRFVPAEPRADNPIVKDGVFIAKTEGKGLMIGIDAWEGWTGAFVRGLFFGVTFATARGKEYPRGPGANNSFWANSSVLEVEPISWFFDLAPGETAEWIVTWTLVPLEDMPLEPEAVAAQAKKLAAGLPRHKP